MDRQADGHYQVHYLPALLSYPLDNQVMTKFAHYVYDNFLELVLFYTRLYVS